MLLTTIFLLLLFGCFFLIIIPSTNTVLLQKSSLIITGCILLAHFLLFYTFDTNIIFFQDFIVYDFLRADFIGLDYVFGIDGISLMFILLTALLSLLCQIFIFYDKNFKDYILLIYLIQFLLILSFSVLNLLLFYIFFEAILAPLFILIGLYGSREKKVRANFLLLFYTIAGSIFMFISILYIYTVTGTLNLELLQTFHFTFKEQLCLWVSFFISFATKIPMFPIHIWLPEAHVEAPTVGSVLLAGILLKLGVYGFIRFSLVLFPQACIFFTPLVYCFSLAGIIYASLIAIKQTDFKRIIAYSSIAHMNLIVLGIFSGNVIGVEAAILQSVSHGFVASALFFLIGMLYNRYHSRFLFYYSGLIHFMPLFSFFFLYFSMANIALPGTSSFIGEFLLLNGLFQDSVFSTIFAGTSVIFSGAYSLWLYNRVIYGNLNTTYLVSFYDIIKGEFFILFLLLFFSLFMGLLPSYFLNIIHGSVIKIFSYSTLNLI